MTETEDMETRVRKALSPILGMKPYVVIVDRSTLQDMHEDLWRLGVYTPNTSRRSLRVDCCRLPRT